MKNATSIIEVKTFERSTRSTLSLADSPSGGSRLPLPSDWWQQLQLESLLTSLGAGVPGLLLLIRDQEERIMYLNQAARDHCGLKTEASAIGRTFHEIFADQASSGGEAVPASLTLLATTRCAANTSRLWFDHRQFPNWYRLSQFPLYAGTGQIAGCLTLLQPVDSEAYDTTGLGSLSSAVELIHHRYASPLSVAELAQLSHLSVRQLERRFLAAFGVTPKQYLLKVRISVACRWLIRGQRTIADIAAECGFYDQSAFTRYFHQFIGVTPLLFRRQHQTGFPRNS